MANGRVTLREVYASQKRTHEVVTKLDSKFDDLSVKNAEHGIRLNNVEKNQAGIIGAMVAIGLAILGIGGTVVGSLLGIKIG